MDFVECLVSFRTRCGVQSPPLRFARNRASQLLYMAVCYGAGKGSDPALLVLADSIAVLKLDKVTVLLCSYSQGNEEGVQMVPRPKPLSIECSLRTAVAVFAHRMCTIWCKSLFQPLKFNSLTSHGAPELAKLQVALYVGVRLPLELAHETALRRKNRLFF